MPPWKRFAAVDVADTHVLSYSGGARPWGPPGKAEDPPGERAGVVAAVDHDRAVHHDRRHARGVAVGLVVGCEVGDRRGIEHGDVRPRALTENAAIGETERARPAARHLEHPLSHLNHPPPPTPSPTAPT